MTMTMRRTRDLLAEARRLAEEEAATIETMRQRSLDDPYERGVLCVRDTFNWRLVRVELSADVPRGTVREERV